MQIATVSALLVCAGCLASAERVTTASGEVEGGGYVDSRGRWIHTFLGIPYAAPPVGKRRFEAPRPAKNWTGVWPALEHAPHCAQYYTIGKKVVGEEDCLYLNVYTPTLRTAALPVLVFIPGGAFMFSGPTNYRPTSLLEEHDIVFVSVAYRVGPLGFLSTEDATVPGNAGLKDQAMALRWVRDNIESFGGDRDRVTLSGSSAGGASVHFHYLSPLSRGLFAHGITSSGNVLMPWSLAKGALEKAKTLAASVGCPTDTSDVMIECLKRRPSGQILSKVPLFMAWGVNPTAPFGPVVEKFGRDPFLKEHPLQLFARGEVLDVPLLAVAVTEEGLFPAATFIDRADQLRHLDYNWNDLAPHLLDYNYTTGPHNVRSINEKVREFYFGSEPISERTRKETIQMLGDRHFDVGTDLATRLHASVVSSSVFLFMFGYRGKVSFSHEFSESKAYFGVSHFDDMYYTLTHTDGAGLTEDVEKAMIKIMGSLWVSFMKSGRPLVSNITWDPIPKSSFETGVLTYLLIKSPTEILLESSDDFGNRKFWGSVGLNENTIEETFRDEL